MGRRYLVVVPPLLGLSVFLFSGCSSSNEENLGGQTSKVAPQKEGTPDFKGYGEAVQYQTKQAAAKNRAAGKGAAGAK
jgi:hypothetical protein